MIRKTFKSRKPAIKIWTWPTIDAAELKQKCYREFYHLKVRHFAIWHFLATYVIWKFLVFNIIYMPKNACFWNIFWRITHTLAYIELFYIIKWVIIYYG